LICRIWRGVTTTENAPKYERIVREQVIPDIEARGIPGFLHIDLARRSIDEGHEFLTIMWFDSLDSVRRFIGEDYENRACPGRGKGCSFFL
jgi:hypothetical protein